MAKRPTKELRRVIELAEEGIFEFRLRQFAVYDHSDLGYFEAPLHCFLLLKLQARQIESLCRLAKSDLAFLPAALTISRSCFEAAVKCLWIMNGASRMDSEARWLAEFRSEEVFLSKRADLLASLGADTRSEREQVALMREFSMGVASRIPSEIRVPERIPDLRSMLRELGEERKYLIYLKLSQYTHAAHHCIGSFREDDEEGFRIRERAEATEWIWAFQAAWPAFAAATAVVFMKGYDLADPIHPEVRAEFDEAIHGTVTVA
jgi:hypothetical protein